MKTDRSRAALRRTAPAVELDAVADLDFERAGDQRLQRIASDRAIDLAVRRPIAVLELAEIDEAKAKPLRVFGKVFDIVL